jgi:hypothetical protein
MLAPIGMIQLGLGKREEGFLVFMFLSAALNLAAVKSFIQKVLRMVLRFVGDKVKVAASREGR